MYKNVCFTAFVSFEEAEVLRVRSEAFLRNAERLYAEGEYDLAAFSVGQCCQLTLKYKLLVKAGAYPRAHSFIRLVRELAKAAEGARRLLEDVVMLTKIEDAYMGSRCLPRRYEGEEVEAMLKCVKEKFKPVVDGFDLYIEEGRETLEAFRRYREVAQRVKEAARRLVGDVRVYVFGSVLTGRFTAASDIDILIVAEVDREAAARLKAEIYSQIDAPLEIHVATPEQFQRWYLRFVDKLEEV